MEIGDRVLAIGAPYALSGTVTSGIISAKGRDLGLNRYDDFLQTDAAINPGNSGGPLVSLEGKVVGINSAIKSRSGGFQGVSLAISSNMAKGVMQQLIRDGVVRRGYLGVELVGVMSAEALRQYGLAETGGVVIARVRDKSPAAKAGLQVDDAIVSVNGRPVREIRELQRTVAGLPLNTPVNLDVVREGQKQTLQITLEEEPKDYLASNNPGNRPRPRRNANTEVETVTVEKAGLELTDVTPAIAEQLGLTPQTTGALITTVENGTPAAAAKLGARMVITKVNKVEVKNAAAAKKAIEKGLAEGDVTLHIVADAGNAIVTLKAK
jgi:serine protease Do